MSSGLLVASLVLAKYFITSLGGAYALKAAAAIHVLAWVLQFYGHGKHEGTTARLAAVVPLATSTAVLRARDALWLLMVAPAPWRLECGLVSLALTVARAVCDVRAGRAPALFESLVQSLLMAPMFICIEVAFRFGFLPAFYKRVEVLVAQRQKEFGTD